MKCTLILTIFLYASCYADLSFIEWKSKYGIQFSDEKEMKHREQIFLDRKKEIENHNSDPDRTYEKTLNRYSMLTDDEFISTKCGTKLPDRLIDKTDSESNQLELLLEDSVSATYPFGTYKATNAPNSVNFTNLMLPVQNQFKCNACWAFATMTQIEGMLKIRNSSYNTVLAPQFLLDCSIAKVGCEGGWPIDAMQWIKSANGGNNLAPTMIDYPYKDVVGRCNKSLSTISVGIKKVKEIYYKGDEGAMKAQIANYGPTVAAIYATSSMFSYKKGIFFDPLCPSSKDCLLLNHAVVIVGYGTDSKFGDYWLAKNSWGKGWGEHGYIRMARNKANNCNIACFAMFSY